MYLLYIYVYIYIYIGLSPLPGIVANKGLGWDSLFKKIMVVTVAGKGDNPRYRYIMIYTPES